MFSENTQDLVILKYIKIPDKITYSPFKLTY